MTWQRDVVQVGNGHHVLAGGMGEAGQLSGMW